MGVFFFFFSCKKGNGVSSEPPKSDVTVSINPAVKYQTMQGFGTSVRVVNDPHIIGGTTLDPITKGLVMNTAEEDAILKLLYADLGLTRIRPATGEDGSIEAVNDNNDPNNTDQLKFDFSWKKTDAHTDLVKRTIPLGVNTYFPSTIKLESWMTESNPDEYVEWAMAIITRWKNRGVELPYYSIINEPGYPRSGIWSGQYLRNVIKLLGPKLEANGFKTKIVIPDDLNATQAYNRSQIILSDPLARKYVGALAFHLYDEPVTNVSKMKQLSTTYNIPLWMIEYSMGANGGRTALEYASLMHDLIATYDVTAIDYMWGFIGQVAGGSANLKTLLHNGTQYTGYRIEKMYYFIGQSSKFIKQGAQRISSSSSISSVKVRSYIDGNKIVTVAINNSGSPLTTTFSFDGTNITNINAVRTNTTENWTALPLVNVNGTSCTTTLSANSITTFTAYK